LSNPFLSNVLNVWLFFFFWYDYGGWRW
jgi:hypothetical protein